MKSMTLTSKRSALPSWKQHPMIVHVNKRIQNKFGWPVWRVQVSWWFRRVVRERSCDVLACRGEFRGGWPDMVHRGEQSFENNSWNQDLVCQLSNLDPWKWRDRGLLRSKDKMWALFRLTQNESYGVEFPQNSGKMMTSLSIEEFIFTRTWVILST